MLQKSTEHHGVGQSGYAAGRHGPDPALARTVQVRPQLAPDGADEPDELDDDRFHGRGGRLAPEEPPDEPA